jgi:hypothetical protein
MQQICKDFNNAKYIPHLTDTSNCTGMKLLTLLVRYFTPQKNKQIKITDAKNVTAGSADHFSKYVMTDILE